MRERWGSRARSSRPSRALDLVRIEQPVGGKEAPAGIGQRAGQIGAAGQQPAALGAEE